MVFGPFSSLRTRNGTSSEESEAQNPSGLAFQVFFFFFFLGGGGGGGGGGAFRV